MNTIKPIAARASLLGAAGYFDQNSDGDVPAAGRSGCKVNEERSYCQGCFRSIPEIRAWAAADAAQRLAIWAQLAERAGMAFPPEPALANQEAREP